MQYLIGAALALFVLFLVFIFPGSYIAHSYGQCTNVPKEVCENAIWHDAIMFWLVVAAIIAAIIIIPRVIRQMEAENERQSAANEATQRECERQEAARLAEDERAAAAAERKGSSAAIANIFSGLDFATEPIPARSKSENLQEVRRLMREGDRRGAVELLRVTLGCGLTEAMGEIDKYA